MKICIAGGGTAGWIAALVISSVRPEHRIIVVDSSKHPIIGVGEGSTGTFTDLLCNSRFNYNIDFNDFMEKTKSTHKYGIKFKNWTKNNNAFFSPNDGTPTTKEIIDSVFCYNVVYNYESNFSELGFLLENNLSNICRLTNEFNPNNHALHFDAYKVGNYFKSQCIKKKNIDLIDDEIQDILLDAAGNITKLICSNSKVDGDFFIDATGFSRLLTKKYYRDWVSYENFLPVNSAIPFFLPLKENDYVKPYTTARALSSGWMWQIPVGDRLGCGYVFCDDFLSDDLAVDEISKALDCNIEPKSKIKFSSGRLKNSWINNCLSIGLAAGFTEPLEATSIHSTVVQIETFALEFLKDNLDKTNNQVNRNIYNQRIARMLDDFKDFLSLHYTGGREDTEFWSFVTYEKQKPAKVDEIIKVCDYRVPNWNDFNEYFGGVGWPLYAWILKGMNHIRPDIAHQELKLQIEDKPLEKIVAQKIQNWHQNLSQQLNNYTNEELYIKNFRR